MNSDRTRVREATWLAVRGGHLDVLRIGLTASAASVARLQLFLVGDVVRPPDNLRNLPAVVTEPGLRPGTVVALALACIPALAVAGFATRVGAARRSRRLRAYRLSGASVSDVRRILGLEGGVGALCGVLGGLVLYALVTWRVVGVRDPGPGDFVPRPLVLAVAAACLVVTVVAAARLAVRGLDPLAAPRAVHGPGCLGRRSFGLLIVGAGLGIVIASPAGTVAGSWTLLVAGVAVALVVAGLIEATAAVSILVARRVAPRTSSPTLLLAARQMADVPHAVMKPARFLTLGVFVAGATVGLRSTTLAAVGPGERDFFVASYRLVGILVTVSVLVAALAMLVGIVEIVVARRRTMAATTSVGASTRAAGLSVLVAVVLPAVPVVLVAAVLGAVCGSTLVGTTSRGHFALPLVEALDYGVGTLLVTCLVLSPSLLVASRSAVAGELRTAA